MNSQSPLNAIKRRWWIVLLMALVGSALAAIPQPDKVDEELVRTYEATHTLLLNQDSYESSAGASVSPGQVALFATVGVVPERVKKIIDYRGNAAKLAAGVLAEFDYSTGALRLTTTQNTAEQAELIADTFAGELTSYLAGRQDELYQNRLASAIERRTELEAQLNDLTESLALEPGSPTLAAQQAAVARRYSVAFEQSEALEASPVVLGFTSLQKAQAVETTSGGGFSAPTSRSTRALMGLLVGATLGAGLAVALGQLDRRVRSREQAESVIDMRARVMIPKVTDKDRDHLIVTKGRHEPLVDSYRTIRNVVGFVQGPAESANQARITLVVSPGPGDGKTSLAVNLAAAMAENGQRTILINSDFRRPRLATALESWPPPLPFTIDDLDSIDPQLLLGRTSTPGLLVMDLSSIDASPGELVRAVIAKFPGLRGLADSIVIDTSPAGSTAEVLELIPHANAIVVVARVGHTLIAEAQRTMAILRDLATAPMILVLGGEKLARNQYYEYTDRPSRGDGPSKFRRRKNDKKAERELEPAQ
jgi:Mrp family chromosome partitioning ATPase